MVIENGVTILDDDQRRIYDKELIPKIEKMQIRSQLVVLH